MAPIAGVQVDLNTGSDDPDSRTRDEIYIGFWGTRGGREFPLSAGDDYVFETGSHVRYTLGTDLGGVPSVGVQPSQSKPGERNDPSALQIDLSSVQYVYIRKQGYTTTEDDDAYNLSSVSVSLYPLAPEPGLRVFALNTGRNGLWLGHEFGHKAWLRDLASPTIP